MCYTDQNNVFFFKAQVAGIAAENVKSAGGKVARITGINIHTYIVYLCNLSLFISVHNSVI